MEELEHEAGVIRFPVEDAIDAVRHHQEQKYANQAAEQQAEQQAIYDQGVAAAQAAQQAAPPPAAAGVDLTAELQKLASLKQAGILTDEEFAAAKAKLLS